MPHVRLFSTKAPCRQPRVAGRCRPRKPVASGGSAGGAPRSLLPTTSRL